MIKTRLLQVSIFAFALSLALSSKAADDKISFSFKAAEVADVVAAYAKASGQKFVVSSSIHGKTTITAPSTVSLPEAYALMSTALAQEGFAVNQQGDLNIVQQARDSARSLIEVVTELPAPQPERMLTLVVRPRNLNVEEVNRQLLRILPSKHGEMTAVPRTNQLVMTDFLSNLYHMKKLIDELDHVSSPVAELPLKREKK